MIFHFEIEILMLGMKNQVFQIESNIDGILVQFLLEDGKPAFGERPTWCDDWCIRCYRLG